MNSIFRYIVEPSSCHYLPDRDSQMEYEQVASMTAAELETRIEQGWRRMGHTLFRPVCQTCRACQPIRILVDNFHPNRNQRRVEKANRLLSLKISEPTITLDRIELYVKHHCHHAEQKGWSRSSPRAAAAQISHFIHTPSPIQEWAYYLDDTLVAISYVDVLPSGFSGVYFYHHPDYRKHSLGTYIVISLIRKAQELRLPYVYLGYFVGGCRSMEYKGRFAPAEMMCPDGTWRAFEPYNVGADANAAAAAGSE